MDPYSAFSLLCKDSEGAVARSQRAAERRKRRAEAVDNEIEEKLEKLDKPGDTVSEIFSVAEAGNATDLDLEKDQKETPTNRENNTLDAETQTQESSVETQNAATQITEFEYLFKVTVVQPFTEEYSVDDEAKVRLYTGLPSFDVFKVTFVFITPFVTRESKTLTLFKEFIMVLIKLRLNVPQQVIDKMIRVCAALMNLCPSVVPFE